MLTHLLRHSALLALVTLFSGCATPTADLVVPINRAQAVPRTMETPRRVQVQVTDIRKEAQLERTTIGAISMGRVTLKPPATELVQAVVEARADEVLARAGLTQPQTVLCGIRVFEVTTPATLAYWDINTKIELVLRMHGQDRTVSGMATERTFIWPTQEIIGRVTNEALRQLGAETERALAELFASSR